MKLAKLTLSLITIPVTCLATSEVMAQTSAPTPTNPIQQPGGFSNSNNSSRQFFQQGRNRLYFLEESDDVLEVDEEISQETEDSTIETEKNQLESAEQEQSK